MTVDVVVLLLGWPHRDTGCCTNLILLALLPAGERLEEEHGYTECC
jgi:hypothetical protein